MPYDLFFPIQQMRKKFKRQWHKFYFLFSIDDEALTR